LNEITGGLFHLFGFVFSGRPQNVASSKHMALPLPPNRGAGQAQDVADSMRQAHYFTVMTPRIPAWKWPGKEQR
jgi:hypothetical protein